ncbi:hypothetical protein GDO81_025886 [Engystomops pustulosus]|uniref:Taste receptor type 2 member 40 n=1 Tax=Engystomops pustulosus TaxID=76066 RepID=A0AAV6ZGK5_ENGPU|nr:hypothetical protein GDO81_025886 [Engystomops pustulosus]
MAPVTLAIIIAIITGLLIHLFIAATIIIQWLHGKPITPIDQVLTSLGVSRMFLQFFSLMDVLLSTSFLDLGVTTLSVIDNLFVFFNYSSIWFATLFAVVFCLKVVYISHRLFVQIKGIVSGRIVPLIILSLVVSISYTMMYLFLVPGVEATNIGVRNGTNFINMLCYFFMLQVIWMHVVLNGFPIAHSIFLICKTNYLRQYFTLLYNNKVCCVIPRRAASSEDAT